MLVRIKHPERLIYPESDGKPMGENTLQVKWIVTLYNGLEALFRDRPNVFVAADLFWYPVYGDPTNNTAPDLLVAFGRPKGDRPSYKQWEEANTPPQVVVEILSPSNLPDDRADKFKFYQRYGVEEFYEYDPDTHDLQAWVRGKRKLVLVKDVDGFVSPRLKVRFEVSGSAPMRVLHPDGTPFRSYLELLAEMEARQQQAADERKRADKLAAKLRALGIDPDAV